VSYNIYGKDEKGKIMGGLIMSYYMHNVPGRLRIKSSVIKNNKTVADELKKSLSTLYGVTTVDINLITGSVLVNYNSNFVKHTDFVDILQGKGYFDNSKALTNDEYIHKTASKAGTVIGRLIFGTFAGMALKETPLSFLAILI
jgi:copper chaperone CopZ